MVRCRRGGWCGEGERQVHAAAHAQGVGGGRGEDERAGDASAEGADEPHGGGEHSSHLRGGGGAHRRQRPPPGATQ
eukprot:2760171-Pyramimonas_sp.AAC.1